MRRPMDDDSDSDGECVSFDPAQAAERLKQAKKRRSQQLKRWCQYEKEVNRQANRRSKTPTANGRANGRLPRRVRFTNSVVLFEAVCRADLNEVQQLLQQGCSANALNTDGLTALHQASIDDNESICKLLLEHGANVNAADSEFWTPLHAAATCGNIRVCKILIDSGANLLAVNSDANMPYDGCEDSMTLSLLEEEMAKRGITQEQIDAARSERENQLLKASRTLLDAGGSIDRVVDDHQKATALHVAAAYGFQKLAEYLLENGASADTMDADGWLPIHAAACWGCFNIVQLLVQYGADMDARTRSGEQIFDICSDNECKRQLLALKEQLKRTQPSHKSSRRKLSSPAENKPNRSNSTRRNSVRTDRRGSISQKEAEVDGNLRALAAASLSSFNNDSAAIADSEALSLSGFSDEAEQRTRRGNGRSADYTRSSSANGGNEKQRFDDADQNSSNKAERQRVVAKRCTIN